MNFEDCRNNADRDKYGLCAAGLGKCESDCVFYMKVNKPTNADCIRGMSDEELAVTLMCPNEMGMAEIPCDRSDDKNCCQCLLDWLKQEVKE